MHDSLLNFRSVFFVVFFVCFFEIPEQSGKVEYERERLLGITNKFIHLLAIPLNIAVYR
jgi:hypothetical protein